jgi:glycosyltransferase involved in cell wall biosynthesis
MSTRRKPLFTVFTPTFNRAHTLHRVYESLKKQTYRNFEWLIIDDGSTDNTYELVKKWEQEADFPIRYFWQENKGKHVAFNRGVQDARGDFFLPFDSDDACVSEALERFKYHWDSIPIEQRELFSGVCVLCVDQNGKVVGDRFPFDTTDSNSLEIYYRYRVKGEKWGFQRTDILRCHFYPEVKNVKFIPEGIVWNAISKTYKIRFVNEVLRIYWNQEFNRSDQLMHALNTAFDHAAGCALYYQSCLNEHITWFAYAPLEFFRSTIHYIRHSLHSGKATVQILQNIRPLISKILVILAIPIGTILYALEKRNINLISKYKSLFKTKA